MRCYDMKYGTIRGKDVIDSKGEKFGEIMDCIFDISNNKIDLKYFVVGGGMVEEFLESIKVKPDIDPILKLDDIENIGDKVHLKVQCESLKKTLDPGVMTENDIKFSALSDVKVEDSDGFKIGFIIDIWYDSEGQMWLVLGGGFFEELLERIHAQPDIDLLVPPHFIESVDRKHIKLNRTRFQLESTCEDEYKKLQRQLEGPKPHDDARYAQLRLGSAHSRGLV